jgi:CheY-like chemotaxis protein
MIVHVKNPRFRAFHVGPVVNLTEPAGLHTISLTGRALFGHLQATRPNRSAHHAHSFYPHSRLSIPMMEPRQPLRVLCADDNVLVLDMLSKTLQSAGHHVEVATDGRAAISRLEEDPDYFQLIVTDTRMPRLDGFGVVEQARSAGFAGKIIVFANALTAEDRQRYADLRVDRVIDKPGKSGELVGAINELQASLA